MRTMITIDYLIENGLLFEINRTILHPLGLELTIIQDSTGRQKNLVVIDDSDDLEHMLFTDEAYAYGNDKLDKYMSEVGLLRLQERREKLGFVVQDNDRVVEDTQSDEGAIEVQKPDKTFPTTPIPSGPQDLKKVETASLSVEERNEEIRKRRARKDGTIESGDDVRSPEKDEDGNCNHVNVIKEPIKGGGSLKFCADCGQPLDDTDMR